MIILTNLHKGALTTLAAFLILAGAYNVLAKNNTQTVGAGGYDVVAYQTQSKAVPGDTNLVSYVDDTAYLFTSKENKLLFDANPKKYLPEFGGYCAMGLTMRKKLPINPEAFTVVDGRLYLNLNEVVLEKWRKDRANNIINANKVWGDIENTHPSQL